MCPWRTEPLTPCWSDGITFGSTVIWALLSLRASEPHIGQPSWSSEHMNIGVLMGCFYYSLRLQLSATKCGLHWHLHWPVNKFICCSLLCINLVTVFVISIWYSGWKTKKVWICAEENQISPEYCLARCLIQQLELLMQLLQSTSQMMTTLCSSIRGLHCRLQHRVNRRYHFFKMFQILLTFCKLKVSEQLKHVRLVTEVFTVVLDYALIAARWRDNF